MATQTNKNITSTNTPLINPFQLGYSSTSEWATKATSDQSSLIVRAAQKAAYIFMTVLTAIAETFSNLGKLTLNVGIAPINFFHSLVSQNTTETKEEVPPLKQTEKVKSEKTGSQQTQNVITTIPSKAEAKDKIRKMLDERFGKKEDVIPAPVAREPRKKGAIPPILQKYKAVADDLNLVFSGQKSRLPKEDLSPLTKASSTKLHYKLALLGAAVALTGAAAYYYEVNPASLVNRAISTITR